MLEEDETGERVEWRGRKIRETKQWQCDVIRRSQEAANHVLMQENECYSAIRRGGSGVAKKE
jgi:hypothetical protein